MSACPAPTSPLLRRLETFGVVALCLAAVAGLVARALELDAGRPTAEVALGAGTSLALAASVLCGIGGARATRAGLRQRAERLLLASLLATLGAVVLSGWRDDWTVPYGVALTVALVAGGWALRQLRRGRSDHPNG